MTKTPAALQPVTVIPVPGVGAEDVLVGADGTVYTGTEDGSVFAIRGDGDILTRVGRTDGRPLGLEWLPDGRLLVCDAHLGLLALDPATGRLEALVTEVDGVPLSFCNNAAVAEDGTVYFSDSSTVHPIECWKADLVEDTRTGRLLRRHPDGGVEVLLDGLRFANGVALAADGSSVYVAETTGRTVVRHRLSGPDAGTTDHLVADLPGYPDNIATGTDGLIWVTIPSPRDPLVEWLIRAPLAVSRLATRLPEALQPAPQRNTRVQAYDDAGTLVHDRPLDASAYHVVTGVREHHGRVWLGSLVESAVAWFAL